MAYRVTSEAFLRPISVASALASTDPAFGLGNKGGGAPQVGKCHPSGQPSTPRAASRPSNRLNFGPGFERFKQGEIDRWGRRASINTPVGDFYFEHP